jgi:hypothetical protein
MPQFEEKNQSPPPEESFRVMIDSSGNPYKVLAREKKKTLESVSVATEGGLKEAKVLLSE